MGDGLLGWLYATKNIIMRTGALLRPGTFRQCLFYCRFCVGLGLGINSFFKGFMDKFLSGTSHGVHPHTWGLVPTMIKKWESVFIFFLVCWLVFGLFIVYWLLEVVSTACTCDFTLVGCLGFYLRHQCWLGCLIRISTLIGLSWLLVFAFVGIYMTLVFSGIRCTG